MTPHPYQEAAIQHLQSVLSANRAAVDGSDCGVGKTLVAVEVMKRLNAPTLVVCPKAVVPGWHRTAAAQGTELDAINYEMVRTGRTPFGEWRDPDLRHRDAWFKWHPGIGLIIFDEAHRCKAIAARNTKSGRPPLTAELMRAARRQNIPALALSATLADTPMEMDALGYLLRLHDSDSPPTLRNPNPLNFYSWARQYGCGGEPFSFNGDTEDMVRLNSVLFPGKGVRVRIPELGDKFPETQITAELCELADPDKMNELYAQMAEALDVLAGRTSRYDMRDPMSQLTAARQQAELLKVPAFESMAEDYVKQGMSVVIFVNFRLTQEELLKRLSEYNPARIDGSQIGAAGARERESERLRFQEDRARILICTGAAGGVGLDLHDVTGRFPRAVLNSPGFDAKQERQKAGRVRRSGAKSKSLQRFIFAAGTVEEGVHACVSRKLDNLDALNDGDLFPQNLRLG